MVKYLLEIMDKEMDEKLQQEELNTALMVRNNYQPLKVLLKKIIHKLKEAAMDGHLEIASLLLDHGAQVNMPVDSFESPLTLGLFNFFFCF